MFSRRRVLVGGLLAGGLAVGYGAGMLGGVLPGGTRLRRELGLTGPDGVVPDVPAATVAAQVRYSAARGRTVNLVTMVPVSADHTRLPVFLVLHGRSSSAQEMVGLGLPRFLTAAVAAGAKPFALVAVDGGDSYWVARGADDPQAMVRNELPGWLDELGLARPSVVLGISMGCFGALVLARNEPLAAVALISPALFENWPDAAARNAFADETTWVASEPLRHVADLPPSLPIGIWCGEEDPFYPAARRFAEQAHPAVAAFESGEHSEGYWRRVMPSVLGFLGARA
ncbi:alpha/beta hydrolase [Amycolatopsis taiwanensis]|uniref:alpha/beta hydrolase n=1 Tax=Amycolatopsis taiwanensis TaxID=342230 RepID=UPI002554E870|nr:alpha/beta hydrolase-fold protein [Amycolatopsis taiwanensis]